MKTSIQEHLLMRHFDVTKYPSVYVSEEFDCVYFYLYNLSGMFVGYQCYTPSKPKKFNRACDSQRRYHTLLTKVDSSPMIGVFGLDILDKTKRTIFLVEGIFDACRLHKLGLNAIALLCSDVSFLSEFLFSLGYKLIPVCEGDKSGLKLASLATHKEVVYLEDGLDLGDMTEDAIFEIFSIYI